MKKALAVLLLALLIPSFALADTDLSSMPVDDLRQLRDDVNLELASRCSLPDVLATWNTTLARVDLLSVRRGVADDGKSGIVLVFAYTNTSTEIDNFRANHWIYVYHDGVSCERLTRLDGVLINAESWSCKVMPGRTLATMEWFFLLSGTEKTIDVEIEDRAKRPAQSAGIVTILLPD